MILLISAQGLNDKNYLQTQTHNLFQVILKIHKLKTTMMKWQLLL